MADLTTVEHRLVIRIEHLEEELRQVRSRSDYMEKCLSDLAGKNPTLMAEIEALFASAPERAR